MRKKVKKPEDPQIFTVIFEILAARVISQDAAKHLNAFGIFRRY
jgi:hypothetical protein